ncbi:N-acetyltransferase [Pedobacter changchengzhani]|uniref:N-acetyltransferase n=1 Tax=Pedobacter changchengzhani TaxID=2529274 RepID=A0A4R5MPR5_9SPHI|nr:GNAT family N-acetyltransferase [Pedobacter changchengzhani]TDG37698.1 N-acetyltransferase [Pedobacter changchengzhani]
MKFPKSYRVLENNLFSNDAFSLVPIRLEDKMKIMNWRNEQVYHLRQAKPLTEDEQNNYFENVVAKLFEQEQPNQILFSFLENGECIGYGGLVHINWIDKNAEISFVMQTDLEKNRFAEIWGEHLYLLEKVAFNDLRLHKIFTYAFDVRQHLYAPLLKSGFYEEARLKQHCFFDDKFIDVIIHSKISQLLELRLATEEDVDVTFKWASDSKVRRFAIQKDAITFENHSNWFERKINADDCVYLIAEVNKKAIGSIRFDIDDKNEALLSFLLDPTFHGKGYGKEILVKGYIELLKLKYISKIIGVVSINNIPSLKTFKSLDFNQVNETEGYVTFEKIIRNENR